MSELRYNPLKDEWVITATSRKNRTFQPPQNYCPLCPSRPGQFITEVAKDYDLVVFENKFPALKRSPVDPDIQGTELYPVRPAQGICEVILYSAEHDATLAQMEYSKFVKLIQVWKDRYRELGQRDFIEYVYIFENKGAEVGVTLSHPHGQIYGYPFLPPFIKTELANSQAYYKKENRCLFCRVLEEELLDKRRIVAENISFVAFVPFFARYNYEVHVMARQHLPSLAQFDENTEADLAAILKLILQKYDNLYHKSFPYIMAIHQQPTNGTGAEYAHFHIEFYPPLRGPEKLKYLAGSEAGAGVFINDSLPEEKAQELRELAPHRLVEVV